MATAIQFLRSSTPRLRPNPSDLASGMPMVNIAPEEPGLYFKTSDSRLFKVGPTFIGTVPPNDGATGFAGNTIGEQWLDVTVTGSPVLKIWDGFVWQEVSGGSGSGVQPSPTPPAAPEEGDLWWDTNYNNLLVWNGYEWVSILNEKSDWNETDPTDPAFIKNKPTVVSEFSNDSGYLTEAEVNNILIGNKPDGTPNPDPNAKAFVEFGENNSVLTNDSGYLTEAEVNNILEGKNPDGTPDAGGKTYVEVGDDNTVLNNAAGFITEAEVNNILIGNNPDGSPNPDPNAKKFVEFGENNSVLTNDSGYLTEAEVNNILEGKNPDGTPDANGKTYVEVGDDNTLLANTANFITSAEAPVQSVNGSNGTVVLNLDDINDVSAGSATSGQVLVYNGTNWANGAQVTLPPSIDVQGSIDVATALPGGYTPSVGHVWIQTANPGPGPVTADASWTGIGGSSVQDGAYVIFGDNGGSNQWFLGNNIAEQEQSDWNETNTSSNAFIQNKPDIGDATVNINESDGTLVGTFTTNQTGANVNISLPAPPTVNDSTVTIKDSGGNSVGSFTTNQSSGSDITLPSPPTVNDSTVTIKDSGGNSVGSFTTNQSSGSDITLPSPPTVNDANLTLTVDTNGTTTDTVFSANASVNKSLTIGNGALKIFASDGTTEVGTFNANQSANLEITLPAGMIEPTSNGSFLRTASGATYTWTAFDPASIADNLQKVTDNGKTTTNDITALALISSEITGAANQTYGAGSGVTPVGNVMPLDLRKLPPLPATRTAATLNYAVTVNNPGSGNVFYLNGNAQLNLDVFTVDTLVFDYSDDSNTGHSFAIYTDSAKTTLATYTTDAAAETITFATPAEGTYYYDCTNHPGMGGTITVTV